MIMTQSFVLQHGPLVIELDRYRVLLNQTPLVLSYREYAFLVYLATHAGHLVTKRRLLEEGLGRHDLGDLSMVEEHIRHLKAKLEQEDHVFIEEVPNAGYRFFPHKKP